MREARISHTTRSARTYPWMQRPTYLAPLCTHVVYPNPAGHYHQGSGDQDRPLRLPSSHGTDGMVQYPSHETHHDPSMIELVRPVGSVPPERSSEMTQTAYPGAITQMVTFGDRVDAFLAVPERGT